MSGFFCLANKFCQSLGFAIPCAVKPYLFENIQGSSGYKSVELLKILCLIPGCMYTGGAGFEFMKW